MLMNPNYPSTVAEVRDVRAAARSLGVQINVLNATTSREIDAAFAALGNERRDALFVGGDPFCLADVSNSCPWRRLTSDLYS